MEKIPLNTEKERYESLTPNSQNKYDTLVNHYGDHTFELISKLEDRGVNSFLKVYEKAEKLKIETELINISYLKLISGSFELDQVVTIEEIVSTVTDCRRKLKFERILAKIKQSCLAELQNYFIIKPVFNEEELELPKNKRRITGYKPVFDLTQLIED